MDNAKAMAGAGPILRDLMDEFGARHVFASFLRLLITDRKMPDVDVLPDHLRRDIGLPPLGEGPPPGQRRR